MSRPDNDSTPQWTGAEEALMRQLYDEKRKQDEATGDWSGSGSRFADLPELDSGKILDLLFENVPVRLIAAAAAGNESALSALRRQLGLDE
jgi:hypothetical protein